MEDDCNEIIPWLRHGDCGSGPVMLTGKQGFWIGYISAERYCGGEQGNVELGMLN